MHLTLVELSVCESLEVLAMHPCSSTLAVSVPYEWALELRTVKQVAGRADLMVVSTQNTL